MAKTKPIKLRQLNLRCTQAQYDNLQATARRNGRSIAAEARFRCFPPTKTGGKS